MKAKWFEMLNPLLREREGHQKRKEAMSKTNKAGYTAIQSRTVGQEQYRKNRSKFRNATDGRTDQHGKV